METIEVSPEIVPRVPGVPTVPTIPIAVLRCAEGKQISLPCLAKAIANKR